MERFNISELLALRAKQRSFHVASEEHIRVEFRNLSAGEGVETFCYAGNVVLTIFAGVFALTVDGDSFDMSELDQLITSMNQTTRLQCKVAGTVQIIWSPAHAHTEKVSAG